MSKELERKLAEAVESAKFHQHEFVTLEHILLALTDSPSSVEVLTGAGCNVQRLKKDLRENLKKHAQKISSEQLAALGGAASWQPEFTLACHRLFQRAALHVQNSGRNRITEGHLLVCFFYESDSFAVYAMTSQGLTQFDVINYVSHGLGKEGDESLPTATNGKADADGLPADESKQSPLDSFCQNLNEKALAGRVEPLIGREDVLERVQQILCRRTKNNPLLIGEPGVGKTAIAEGLAARIVAGKVPSPLLDKIVFSLDLGSLLAGTKFRGDFESRLKAVLKEIKKRKNILLFIDEIHTIVGAGATSGGSMDASNLLKPALASGEISCIGSTTYQEFRQHFEKDRALHRRFQRVDVKEPTSQQAIEILRGLQAKFEQHHNVRYSDEAIIAAVELSNKYLPGKLLPDKAIDVMDEAGASFKLRGQSDVTLMASDLEEVVAKMAQVPPANVSSNDREQLRDLDRRLKSVIFGQDEAIDKVVAAIKLSRSGLSRDTKPIGAYLFAGPTGVGKTEVCKKLAEMLGVPLVRFDMSEYMEKHAVARLIGAPPGYVGYDEGGQLTEAIHRTPHCVLLLDEMEKAHPDIANVLLQVMDAGRLTDANGRTTDFRNVILVMTSNAGAAEVAKGSIGLVPTASKHSSMEAIKKVFAPEFLNRLDAVVHFQQLAEPEILRVVGKFLEELQMQLAKSQVHLQVSDEVKQWLMQKGYDKVYGARPMARTIDEHIKQALVEELLFGRLQKGGRVRVSLRESSLSFEFEAAGLPALVHR